MSTSLNRLTLMNHRNLIVPHDSIPKQPFLSLSLWCPAHWGVYSLCPLDLLPCLGCHNQTLKEVASFLTSLLAHCPADLSLNLSLLDIKLSLLCTTLLLVHFNLCLQNNSTSPLKTYVIQCLNLTSALKYFLWKCVHIWDN